MEIVLKREASKMVEVEEVFKSGFYELKYGGFLGIYTEDKVVSVAIINEYATVAIGSLKIQTMCNPVIISEISEQEFNEQLAKAMFMISGVEVGHTLAL